MLAVVMRKKTARSAKQTSEERAGGKIAKEKHRVGAGVGRLKWRTSLNSGGVV